VNLCLIVGTRPQIIKSQPIINEINSKKAKLSIIHTGQHYDYELSRAFFKDLKIREPDYNLNIIRGSPIQQLSEIISKLEKPLQKIKPDMVIIPGDTRSALGAALAANRLDHPIAHIESGARSFDLQMEEEVNRRLIDHCSTLLFAPTKICYSNLKKESVLGQVFLTGDTMYDIFLYYKRKLNLRPANDENLVVMTVHRKENIYNYNKIKKILNLAQEISKLGVEVVFPIHPHTKKQIKAFKLSLTGIQTVEPVTYSEMLKLLSKSTLLLTDSGGLQKEAFWLGIQCITFRGTTEWVETLSQNRNILFKKIPQFLPKQIKSLLTKPSSRKTEMQALFGEGNASKKIASILLKEL